MPLMDRGIELHSGIAADVRSFSNLAEQTARFLALARRAVAHPTGPPFAVFDGRVHKLITHARAQVFVLIHDGAVGIAVVASVITLFDQSPGLLLFFLL